MSLAATKSIKEQMIKEHQHPLHPVYWYKPQIHSTWFSWGNRRHLLQLPEGWEENASCCECRFMLHRQPRVCECGAGALWILSWELLSHHLHDYLLGSPQLRFPHCAMNTEETALTIAFLLLQGGRLLVKSETDLRGNGKGTSTLVLLDIWELHSSGCNLAVAHLALPGSLLA